MKKTILAVLLSILMAAVLGACTQPAATAEATPSAAPSATVTPMPPAESASPSATPGATGPTSTPGGVTENRLGNVTDAYSSGGTNYIKIDYVDMYTGDEAIAKALADGSNVVETDENGNQYIPNDYYIRNVNTKVRTFPLGPGCTIGVFDQGDPNASLSITFTQFQSLDDPLMHVNVVGGTVVTMTQQYLP